MAKKIISNQLMQFFDKIKTKSSKFWQIAKPILMRRNLYIIYLPIIASTLLLLIALPFTFDNSALKFKIEEKVKEVLKSDFEINGDVSVALFPSPAITMDNVYLQNYQSGNFNYNFYAKRLTVKSSYASLILGNYAIKDIVVGKMILEKSDLRADSKQTKNNSFTEILQHRVPANKNAPKDGISAKIFAVKDFNLNALNAQNFPDVTLEEGEMISYDRNFLSSQLKNINAELQFSKNKISGQGSFSNQDLTNNFELLAHFHSASGKNKSYFRLTSSYASFIVSGDFLAENKGIFASDFIGKIEGEIFDFKNFYKSFVSASGLVYNKINPTTKPIKISANINDNSGEIIITNINIASAIANGSGNAVIDLSTKIPLIDLRFDFQSIDLDSFWLHDKIVEVKKEEEKTDSPSKDLENSEEQAQEQDDENLTINLSKDFRNYDITAEINIAQLAYLEEDVKNINLYLTISKEGELLILPLTLEAPGGGLLRMNGALTSGINPKFVGKIDISGNKLGDLLRWLKIDSQNLKYDNLKEYILYSDIMLAPTYGSLGGLYLNINNSESELLGDVRIDYAHKTSNIISNFRVNKFDLSNYFLTSGQNAYLSYGKLLTKLLWLNDFSSNNDMSFAFDNLSYNGTNFKNQSVKLRFGQGYFEVRDLKLKSDDNAIDLTAAMAVDISGSAPKFDISIIADKYTYRSSLTKSEEKSDADENKTEEKSKIIPPQITAIDQFFALPSLEGFSGKIYIDLQDSDFDDVNIKKLKIEGNLKDGVIEFSKLNCLIFDGRLDYKGSIAMKLDKSFSGNLALENIALKTLFNNSIKLKGIDGTANIASSIVSVASKKEEFIKNLDSDIKFSAGNVNIDKFGLNDLVKKMFNVKNYITELREPEKILFNDLATTNFKKSSGEISIKKGRADKLKIDFSALAINGVLLGKANLVDNSIDATANIIFLSGDRKKQIPINIASSIKGSFDNVMQSTNLDQVKQYLGLMPRGAPKANTAPVDENNKDAIITTNAQQQPTQAANPSAPESELQQQLQDNKKTKEDLMKIMQNAGIPAQNPAAATAQ